MASKAPTQRPSAALQRLYRGFDALLAPLHRVDDAPAAALLSPALRELYQRMSKADRAHSLRVLAWLQAHGHTDPDLLAAALLHDCAKAATRLRIWHRTLKVLLKRLAPAQWAMLSRPARPGSWRYPFYILRAHPFRGAYGAEEAGASETTVWLIRLHETDPDPTDPRLPLMQALQEADAAS